MSGYVLPEGWRWARLGDACQTKVETRDPRQTPDMPFNYVDIASVNNQAKMIKSWRELLGRDAPSRARKVIRFGDVIVATTRPYLNAVAYVPADLDGEICSTGFCVLRAMAEATPRFLFAFVQTQSFIEQVSGRMRGASYPAVSDRDVFAVLLPLPPLDEQRRIVARLEALLAEVERAEAEIEAEAEKTERLMTYAVSAELNKLKSEGCLQRPLGDVLVRVQYGTSQRADEDSGGVPVLRMGNVQDGCLDLTDLKYVRLLDAELEKFRLEPGDILINRTNSPELVGKSAVFLEDGTFVFASYLIRLRADPKWAEPRYLNYFINSTEGRAYVDRTRRHIIGQANINAKEIRAMPVLVPSVERQRRIADHLGQVHAHVRAVRLEQAAMLEKLSRLRASLLDAAFRGKS
ncbi:MAG: restriction endonuclease subunit S [Chloroflexi bacterium]|nr:restriction endonuclease subunit S [Chloroflexota bacterium]